MDRFVTDMEAFAWERASLAVDRMHALDAGDIHGAYLCEGDMAVMARVARVVTTCTRLDCRHAHRRITAAELINH